MRKRKKIRKKKGKKGTEWRRGKGVTKKET